MYNLNMQVFHKVDCFFYGMYGDCSYPYEATKDENHICNYSESPAACYCCVREEMGDKEIVPKGSTEKVWKFAHPSDVGLFRDGKGHGWYIRHSDYLKWEPSKLKQWLANKPSNIYLPGKMGIYKRPEA